MTDAEFEKHVYITTVPQQRSGGCCCCGNTILRGERARPTQDGPVCAQCLIEEGKRQQ